MVSVNGGGYWDFGNKSLLFQDTAGTIPITAAGQSVARANDKSGNGKHVAQATAGLRPIYRVDAAGRGYCDFSAAGCCLTSAQGLLASGAASVMFSADLTTPDNTGYRVVFRQYNSATSYALDGLQVYCQPGAYTWHIINRISGALTTIPEPVGLKTCSVDSEYRINDTYHSVIACPSATSAAAFSIGGNLGELPGRGVKLYALAVYSGSPGSYKAAAIRRLMAIAGLA
jgi:hypothetical protein